MNSLEPQRISAQDIHGKLTSDDPALLVCIYSTELYNNSHLEGAISMEDFLSRIDSLPKDAEIAFY